MSVFAATLGTSFYVPSGPPPPSVIDLGAGYGPTANPSDGTLFRREYIGYHTDDMNWFLSAPLLNALADPGITVNETTTNNELSDNFSVMWTGYFYAPSGGQYRFGTASDDGSYLWIGDKAINDWRVVTADVQNGGPHGLTPIENTTDVLMVGGRWYPIRMVFGEFTGGAVFSMSVELVGSGPVTPIWQYSQGSPEGF
jgi:hypothetical protein